MTYHQQFKVFNPLSDQVPATPFSLLPSIANRARVFLKTRTVEQIDSAARAIDFAIYCYFDEAKQNEIARLRQLLNEERRWKRESQSLESSYDSALRFFEWDGGTEANGRWIFIDGMEEELEIPTPWNTGEIDAFKECIDWWDDLDKEGFPNGKPCELFAVLSLWMLADALHWLNASIDKLPNSFADFEDALDSLFKASSVKISDCSISLSLAGESALKAMEALCYAEHLSAVENAEKVRTKHLEKQKNDDQIRRSMMAERLNKERHRKTNDAKALAIDEWSKAPSRWPSAEKAGREIADWLITTGHKFEPRTVTGWIRDYAKKTGVKFR